MNVAAVDADAHQSLAQQYGIRGFPTIKLFYAKPDGTVTSGSSDYQGQRGAPDIVTWAIDKARAYALKRLGEPSGGSNGGSGGGGARRPSGGGGGGDGGFYSGTDVVTLTDGNFDPEVLQSDDPWMVEFYAPW